MNKVLTCLKNQIIPRLLIWDLILTNSVRSFQSCALETGLSDFHKIQLLSLNHNWKRNDLKYYLIATLGNSKTVILDHKFFEIIVCTPSPFCWGRGVWASYQIFRILTGWQDGWQIEILSSSQGGLDRISSFRGGLLRKRGVTFFKVGGRRVAIFT